MKRIMQFTAMHRRGFFTASAFFALLAVCTVLTGCAAPTWLQDAGTVITLVGSSFASIASFIAGLTGNTALAASLAVVSKWIADVQTGVQDIELLVEQYQESPSAYLLQKIEDACTDVKANIKTDFSNLNLPPTVLNVISGIAGVALQQLLAWSSLFTHTPKTNTVGAAQAGFNLVKSPLHGNALDPIIYQQPMSKKEYKMAVNLILMTETGDPEVDAALAKVKRL